MATTSSIAIRRARRDDVGTIVAMLADDPLGSARERLEDPLPQSYLQAFEAVDRDPNIHLVVAQDGEADVVGCLQLCVLPGLSSQGASRAPDRGRSRCRVVPQPRHRRADWCNGPSPRPVKRGCKLVELLTHKTRIDAQRFYVRLGFQPSHVGMTLRF